MPKQRKNIDQIQGWLEGKWNELWLSEDQTVNVSRPEEVREYGG